MIGGLTPVPRSEALGTGQTRRAGDAGHDAVAACDYTTGALLGIPQSPCLYLVAWLHCHACLRDSFAASVPSPQPCPVWAGGRLQLIALWDVRRDAAPPERLLGGEVSYAHLG